MVSSIPMSPYVHMLSTFRPSGLNSQDPDPVLLEAYDPVETPIYDGGSLDTRISYLSEIPYNSKDTEKRSTRRIRIKSFLDGIVYISSQMLLYGDDGVRTIDV